MSTKTFEKYLEVIYEIERSSGEVRVKDIAEVLHVSYPSVSEMVDRLVKNGYAEHDKYRHINLTPEGEKIASGLDRKHELIRKFFTNVLGVDHQTADSDACEIEHVISDETLDKLVKYLESEPRAKRRS